MSDDNMNNDLDDDAMGDPLDGLDFGFGDEGGNDRKPAGAVKVAADTSMSFLKGSAGGMTSAIVSAMPRTGELAAEAGTVVDEFDKLKTNFQKELGPSVRSMKLLVNKALPSVEKFLPNKLAAKLKEVTTEQAQASERRADERQSQIQSYIAGIFDATAEKDAALVAEQRVNKVVDRALDKTRHSMNMDALASIGENIMFQNKFIKTTQTAYMKKTLELRYQQLFASKDMLKQSVQQTKILEGKLEDIKKNTGLPDVVKLRNTEILGQLTKDKALNKVADYTTGFASRVAKNAGKQLHEKVIGSMVQARQMMDDLGGALDMQNEMGAMMGEAPESAFHSGGKTIGGMGGKLLGTVGGRKLIDLLSPVIDTVEGGAEGMRANMAGMYKKGVGKLAARAPMLAEILQALPGDFDPTVQIKNDLLDGGVQSAVFDQMTRQTIVEIIPRELALNNKILKDIAYGGEHEMEMYDVTTRTFGTLDSIKSNMSDRIFGDKDTRSSDILTGTGQFGAMSKKSTVDFKEVQKDISIFIANSAVNPIDYMFSPDEIIAYANGAPDTMSPYIAFVFDGAKNPYLAATYMSEVLQAQDGKLRSNFIDAVRMTIRRAGNDDGYKELTQLISSTGMQHLFGKDIDPITGIVSKSYLRDEKLSIDDKRYNESVNATAESFESNLAAKDKRRNEFKRSISGVLPPWITENADKIAKKNWVILSDVAEMMDGEFVDDGLFSGIDENTTEGKLFLKQLLHGEVTIDDLKMIAEKKKDHYVEIAKVTGNKLKTTDGRAELIDAITSTSKETLSKQKLKLVNKINGPAVYGPHLPGEEPLTNTELLGKGFGVMINQTNKLTGKIEDLIGEENSEAIRSRVTKGKIAFNKKTTKTKLTLNRKLDKAIADAPGLANEMLDTIIDKYEETASPELQELIVDLATDVKTPEGRRKIKLRVEEKAEDVKKDALKLKKRLNKLSPAEKLVAPGKRELAKLKLKHPELGTVLDTLLPPERTELKLGEGSTVSGGPELLPPVKGGKTELKLGVSTGSNGPELMPPEKVQVEALKLMQKTLEYDGPELTAPEKVKGTLLKLKKGIATKATQLTTREGRAKMSEDIRETMAKAKSPEAVKDYVITKVAEIQEDLSDAIESGKGSVATSLAQSETGRKILDVVMSEEPVMATVKSSGPASKFRSTRSSKKMFAPSSKVKNAIKKVTASGPSASDEYLEEIAMATMDSAQSGSEISKYLEDVAIATMDTADSVFGASAKVPATSTGGVTANAFEEYHLDFLQYMESSAISSALLLDAMNGGDGKASEGFFKRVGKSAVGGIKGAGNVGGTILGHYATMYKGLAQGAGNVGRGLLDFGRDSLPHLKDLGVGAMEMTGDVLGSLFGAYGQMGSAAIGGVKDGAGGLFNWMTGKRKKGATEKVVITDQKFFDIYLRGEVELGRPLLSKKRQESGECVFFDGSPVTDSKEIDGPVISTKDGSTLILQEDINHGLVTVEDKPIAKAGLMGRLGSGLGKGISGLFGGLKGLGGGYTKLLGSAMEMGSDAIGGLFNWATGKNKDSGPDSVTNQHLLNIVNKLDIMIDYMKPIGPDHEDDDGDGDRDGSYEDQQGGPKGPKGGKGGGRAGTPSAGAAGGSSDSDDEDEAGYSVVDQIAAEVGMSVTSKAFAKFRESRAYKKKLATRLKSVNARRATQGLKPIKARTILSKTARSLKKIKVPKKLPKMKGKWGIPLAIAGALGINALGGDKASETANYASMGVSAGKAAGIGDTSTKLGSLASKIPGAGKVAGAYSTMGQWGTKATNMLAKVPGAGAAGGAMKWVGKKLPPILALKALYDGVQGYGNAEERMGKDINWADRALNGTMEGVHGVFNAVSFGMLEKLVTVDDLVTTANEGLFSQFDGTSQGFELLGRNRMWAYGFKDKDASFLEDFEDDLHDRWQVEMGGQSDSWFGSDLWDDDDYASWAEEFGFDPENAAHLTYFKKWMKDRCWPLFNGYMHCLKALNLPYGETDNMSAVHPNYEKLDKLQDAVFKKILAGKNKKLIPSVAGMKAYNKDIADKAKAAKDSKTKAAKDKKELKQKKERDKVDEFKSMTDEERKEYRTQAAADRKASMINDDAITAKRTAERIDADLACLAKAEAEVATEKAKAKENKAAGKIKAPKLDKDGNLITSRPKSKSEAELAKQIDGAKSNVTAGVDPKVAKAQKIVNDAKKAEADKDPNAPVVEAINNVQTTIASQPVPESMKESQAAANKSLGVIAEAIAMVAKNTGHLNAIKEGVANAPKVTPVPIQQPVAVAPTPIGAPVLDVKTKRYNA